MELAAIGILLVGAFAKLELCIFGMVEVCFVRTSQNLPLSVENVVSSTGSYWMDNADLYILSRQCVLDYHSSFRLSMLLIQVLAASI